jgi:hypothetical protein
MKSIMDDSPELLKLYSRQYSDQALKEREKKRIRTSSFCARLKIDDHFA